MAFQPYTVLSNAKLCALSVVAKNWENAFSYALSASMARDTTVLTFTDFTRYSEKEALLRGGAQVRARKDVHDFGERVGPNIRYRIPYLRSLALLAHYDGETEQAMKHLQLAAQLAEEIGLPGELWQIQAVLKDLYQSNGQEVLAHESCVRVSAIIHELAGQIQDEALRTAFLQAPLIRRALEKKTV